MRQTGTTDCQTEQIHHLTPASMAAPGVLSGPSGTVVRPYYAADGVTLYHADCFAVLPLLAADSVDLLLTDPPYSSGGQTAGQRQSDPREKYCQNGQDLGRPTFSGDNRDQRSFAWWATLWMSQCHRIVKPSGYVLTFTDWRQLPLMSDILQAGQFLWRGVIAWDKGGGARAPHKGYFRHQCEYVAWGTKGACRKAEHAGPFAGCYRYPVLQRDKFHMTGKPTPLLRDLVACVPQGAVVLDPFAGSGTSGVAALQTGRQWIGIEAEERYCEIAAKRLQTGV